MTKTLLSAAVMLLLFCAKINAQTTITTWYVIPPTSGCNGVWAIDNNAAGCGSTYQFVPYLPQFCGSFIGPVADTMFIQLCAFPCDLTIVDINGDPCGHCGTGTMTNTENNSSNSISTTYPNPATSQNGWNILLHQPGENVTVNIYNSLGQRVVSENHSQSDQIVHVDISNLVAGIYTAQISVNGAVTYNQQLIVTY